MKTRLSIFFAFTAILLFSIFSCTEKKESLKNQMGDIILTPELVEKTERTPIWNYTDKKIILVLAHSFNDEEFISNATELIKKTFGLAQDGGAVYIMTYPADFKHGNSERLTNLKDKVEELDAKGVIIFGAPLDTHTVLGKIQDNYDGNHTFPVFSLFPQDDILGTESVSDIVIEHERKEGGTESEDVDKLSLTYVKNSVELMLENIDNDLQNSDLTLLAEKIVQNNDIKHYVDGETGLSAINHFVISIQE